MSVGRRTWTVFGGGVALALTVTAAAAEGMNSANDVMMGCRSYLNTFSAEPMKEGHCLGFIEGIVSMGGSVGRSPAAAAAVPGLCLNPPAGSTVAQGVRVVVAYIDARPARMHEFFVTLALEALRTAWPCK
jgi:hypothetical protein